MEISNKIRVYEKIYLFENSLVEVPYYSQYSCCLLLLENMIYLLYSIPIFLKANSIVKELKGYYMIKHRHTFHFIFVSILS